MKGVQNDEDLGKCILYQNGEIVKHRKDATHIIAESMDFDMKKINANE